MQMIANGFLAAGLIWSLINQELQIRIFFLSCVFIAGLYGSFTANKKILYIQALLAALALILVYIAKAM